MKPQILTAIAALMAPDLFGATALHHYTFDTDAVADSVGSADGTLLGGAIVSAGMLRLDGTNAYVQFADKLVPANNFSVAFFAQELTPTSDRAEVISQGFSFGPGFYVGYYGADRPIRVGDQWQATGRKFPADGLPHHYAVTTGPLGADLYIDGALVATNSPIQVLLYGDQTRLGQQFEGYGEFFHGNIDDLWVFSGVLSPAEVSRLALAKQFGPFLNIEISQFRLCWQSEPGVLYQVQYRSDLTTNQWMNLGSPVSGTSSNVCVTDDVTSPGKFYRTVTLP